MRIASILLPASILILSSMGAHCDEAWRAKVDGLYSEWDSTTRPGVMVAILDGGEFVYKRGFGMANLETGAAIDGDSMFNMASISKQFTAAAIAQLSLDGSLSLEDPVGTYLDDLPPWGKTVTIAHLVHHTSGVPDVFGVMAERKIEFDRPWGNEEVLPIIGSVELDFVPGEKFSYSNSNYILLAEIARKASGVPMREYLEEHFFAPLGMTRTRVDDNLTELAGKRAESYHRRGKDRFVLIERMDYVVGDGNVVTTANDFAKWDANLRDPKVGGVAWRDLMLTTGKLNDGTPIEYAFGLFVRDDETNGRIIQHSGGWLGFRTQYTQLADEGISLIAFANHNMSPKAGEALKAYMEGR